MTMRRESLPPLQCFRAFLAVEEFRHFTRAADVLGLTQTAVSHQIAQLEERLGCKLFNRAHGKITLTHEGERLLPYLREGLEMLHRGVSAVQPPEHASEVVISVSPEFGAQWLAPRLADFLSTYPEMRISVRMEHRRVNLVTDDIDLALWLGVGDPAYDAEPLGFEEEFPVCSPALKQRLPAQNAFMEAPLLTYAGARHTVLDWERWYEQVVRPDGVEFPSFETFNFSREYPTFSAMLEDCIAGEGFALVRSSLVTQELAQGLLVRGFDEAVLSDVQYHLVVPDAHAMTRETALVRAWLLRSARDDGKA